MSLKEISRPQIAVSKIGKKSQKTELSGKMFQHNRVTTGDTTREIIPALTMKNSFILKEACNNTGDSNTDFSSLYLSASAPDGQQ